MAGSQITLDHSSHSVLEVLEKLLHQASDLEPAMMEISEYLHERTRDRFDNEEGPDGSWAPLSAATQKEKTRKGVSVDKILHGESLHLRDMIVPFFSGTQAGVGTGPATDAYAATHQFGDDRRGIPARPFLGLDDADEEEVIAILSQFLDEAL